MRDREWTDKNGQPRIGEPLTWVLALDGKAHIKWEKLYSGIGDAYDALVTLD